VKFTVTMKDPDALYESAQEAAQEFAKSIEGLDADERQAVRESRYQKLADFAGEWMRYGEYIDVEFDTEAKTATVIKDGK